MNEGNKGAASKLLLYRMAGKYSVLMPNTSKGGGISQVKFLTNFDDRKKIRNYS